MSDIYDLRDLVDEHNDLVFSEDDMDIHDNYLPLPVPGQNYMTPKMPQDDFPFTYHHEKFFRYEMYNKISGFEVSVPLSLTDGSRYEILWDCDQEFFPPVKLVYRPPMASQDDVLDGPDTEEMLLGQLHWAESKKHDVCPDEVQYNIQRIRAFVLNKMFPNLTEEYHNG